MPPLKKVFLQSINLAGQRCAYAPPADLNPFESLPELLKRFFQRCGYSGTEKVECAHIKWKNAAIRFTAGSKWKSMSCYQMNFLYRPVRLAYMSMKMYGLVPVEALDKFQDGRGSMCVKMLGMFTVNDAKGKEMDQAELVTILAETMIVPHYALQKYITWEVLGPFSLKGVISYNGTTATGIFEFNSDHECTNFRTQDRYMTKNNTYLQTPWTATAKNYVNRNGIRIPSEFSAIWHTSHGDFEYFKGAIEAVEFNHTAIFEL